MDVLVAVHHVLNDSTLLAEKKHQFYKSLCAGLKMHNWLDVCNHPHAWSILHDSSQSDLFMGGNAGPWNLDSFAHGWTDLPLNATGVSHQHFPYEIDYLYIAFIIHIDCPSIFHKVVDVLGEVGQLHCHLCLSPSRVNHLSNNRT